MSLDRWLINLLSLIAISFSCLLEKEPSYVVKEWNYAGMRVVTFGEMWFGDNAVIRAVLFELRRTPINSIPKASNMYICFAMTRDESRLR